VAEQANGSRRLRLAGECEIEALVYLLRKHRRSESHRSIMVYSRDGFVPASYKRKADMTRLTAIHHGWWGMGCVRRCGRCQTLLRQGCSDCAQHNIRAPKD